MNTENNFGWLNEWIDGLARTSNPFIQPSTNPF